MVTRGFLRMTVAARDVDLAPWLHDTAPQEGRGLCCQATLRPHPAPPEGPGSSALECAAQELSPRGSPWISGQPQCCLTCALTFCPGLPGPLGGMPPSGRPCS